ncbi:Lin0512 family protein [Alphaproteobacteria bacterium]|nr:Lin0512 family protein [Alphaproteobacteria bacterium]
MSGPQLERLILEVGMGNDLYGEDYTKAALRAVQDALHHSSLTLFRSLDLDSAKMEVRVTIGVAKPELVDCDAVAASLPRGQASVQAVSGGMNVVDAENGTTSVIASAAVEAFYPMDEVPWMVVEAS